MEFEFPANSTSQQALMACVLEATARKPGNVHPAASFDDLTYEDFVQSAVMISLSLAHGGQWRVGRLVLDAVSRRIERLQTNTNLGIILLLAPLVSVPPGQTLQQGIGTVLAALDQVPAGNRRNEASGNGEGLNREGRSEKERDGNENLETCRDDAGMVYAAIRLANPGGLGTVEHEDVAKPPTVSLVEAMRLTADRDSIAAQYANGFSTVFAGVDRLTTRGQFSTDWETAVIDLHLWLMATCPDTLIARKCGSATAQESARRAADVLNAGWPQSEMGRGLFAELDAWLRSDGHRRNPGTTADLVAACLFAAFRDGRLQPPTMPDCAQVIIDRFRQSLRSRKA